ncbi:hypothetical protein CHGG_00040 [Chaetomium globosum CBS 148.51]|uniref:HD domain-containing protein n=1 Tax=Chaetomium globosum (strain ATCC 6205 / CBS 148.51 / DSM 1962 / NBRC 6347 / NRRL 1970) TaxID=306901 RepID=Q2HIB4_CHAGB|nr:uncharacterized protein CHGG_00040 [Chaetomium globosum CBS 148.51]EAQ91805.1 hypothetical protein CHGG_00040 [Chaetomium globosum CBS 148.51]
MPIRLGSGPEILVYEGTLMLQHNTTLQSIVDPEVHAVALLLHDLGFERTPNSTIVTLDHRFEVDGAIAARKFIRAHPRGRHWEERRVQLVWDAIALHGEHRFSFSSRNPRSRQLVNQSPLISLGPVSGFQRPSTGLYSKSSPQAEDFKDSVVETMSWLCRTKPEMTYVGLSAPPGCVLASDSQTNRDMLARLARMDKPPSLPSSELAGFSWISLVSGHFMNPEWAADGGHNRA